MPQSTSFSFWLAAWIVALLLIVGCARPDSMHVREGAGPAKVDEDVAFRTTYYFRVFDYCASVQRQNSEGNDKYEGIVPLTDSLYRFRMTGKADTLATQIRFESGSLKSYQIDPLGAQVEYDKNTKRFRFLSQREADQQARTQAALAEFYEWLERYRKLIVKYKAQKDKARKTDDPATEMDVIPKSTLEKVKDVMEARLDEFASRKRDQAANQTFVNDERGTWVGKYNAIERALISAKGIINKAKGIVNKKEAFPLAEKADSKAMEAKVARDAWLKATTDYTEAVEAHRDAKAELLEKEKMLDTAYKLNLASKALVTTEQNEEELKTLKQELNDKKERRSTEVTNLKNNLEKLKNDVNKAKSKRDKMNGMYRKSAREADLAERKAAEKLAEILQTAQQRNLSVDQDANKDSEILCPTGLTKRRGFQILGPEGWRTFDQDERLILAMSTSASPLIGTLKELSKRVLNARAGEETKLLPLVVERLRTAEAEAALRSHPLSLDSFASDKKNPLEQVLKAFDKNPANVVK